MIENEILNHKQVEHKIRRIAYQIAEVYISHDRIVIAGIAQGGYTFAKEVKKALAKIIDIDIVLCKVTVNKTNPLEQVATSLNESQYTNCGVILCDDVLNSGTTLIYAVKHFLNVPLDRFKTAVLVNRNHKKYPVKADFKGISLSTTIEEHIEVQLDKKPFSVILK